ncbi:MAG: FAD-dependent oxidoreductase [Actinobacteria bacterium]|nr:FAD-dependent oxidoreductase [Actinomycetota bacterium]
MPEQKPSILAIDDEPEVLNAVVRDLRTRYGKEYRLLPAGSGEEGIEILKDLQRRGEPLALILTDQRMPLVTGLDVLRESVDMFPSTRRALLTAYADTDVAINAINEIGLDQYIMKPWDPPAERLYPVVDDLLDDWLAGYRPTYSGVRVISQPWSRAAHELKAFLAMNRVPYRSVVIGLDDDAETLLASAGAEIGDLPVVVLEDGQTLIKPDAPTLAERIGLKTHASSPAYDVAIIGGGPAGLAAAVYGASEGLKTVLIESSAPGGQAGQSSLIENYLGFPKGISGGDLARRAFTQASRFGAEILVPATVSSVERDDPYRIVHLADGSQITTKALVISTGVSYRKLAGEGIDDLIGAGVYYGTSRIEAENHRGQPMYVVGGGNSAGQAAMFLTRFTDSVTIAIRSADLGATMSQYLIDNIEAAPEVSVLPYAKVVAAHGDDHLESLVMANVDTEEETTVPAGALFIFIGQMAHTDWLGNLVQKDAQGFVLTGNDLADPLKGWNVDRDPLPLESSVPGIFVAGDVRHGSIRRVAGATGEGSTAIRFVHQHLASL